MSVDWRRFRPQNGPNGDTHAFVKFVNRGQTGLCGVPRNQTRNASGFRDWQTTICDTCLAIGIIFDSPATTTA